jgi:hypothetical protein
MAGATAHRRPRAGGGGDSLLPVVGVAALICFTPVAFIVAAATMAATLVQRSFRWWEVALFGVYLTAIAVAINLYRGNGATAYHFWYLRHAVGALFHLDPVGFLLGLWSTVALGLPVGVTVGGLLVPVVTYFAGGAEWHPLEVRRGELAEDRTRRKSAAMATNLVAQSKLPSPPIGVVLDGSAKEWITNGFVCLPKRRANLGMVVVGAPGSGKTVTLQRMLMAQASMGRKVVLVDLKGTDPDHPNAQIDAYRMFRPEARVMRWPEQPLDMWRGSSTELVNRLMQVQDFTEPFYKHVTQTILRLALSPADAPCRRSEGFLARLDPDYLKRMHGGGPRDSDLRTVIRRPEILDGVRMRYSGFFAALDGQFDGSVSFDDFDLLVLTIPSLAAKEDAAAYAKILLADFSHFCTVRKPRTGHDVTLVIDEFSAVPSAAPLVIDLAERVRDVGGQVIVSAQSFEGLGETEDERKRLVGACPGGLILHAQDDPEALLKAAGTVRKAEQSWQLESGGGSGMGSMRMGFRMAIDPDLVRQAGIGEAWIIARGRYVHMQVLPVPPPRLRAGGATDGGRPWQPPNEPQKRRQPPRDDQGGDPFDV